jgi:peptide/nickel transport system permease protein
MRRVILGRLLHSVLVVALVVTSTFILVRLAPGDPFVAMFDDESIPADVRAELVASYGFGEPIPAQFGRFLAKAARGDLGYSVSRHATVGRVLASALPNTLLLMGIALVLGVAGGVAAGAWQGWRPDSALARVTDRLGLVALSVPEFVLALLLMLGPALALGLFPVGGMRQEFGPTGIAGVVDLLHHAALPALSLAIVLGAVVARHQRAAMREVRDAEFVRAARAKGIPERRILLRHALRNALVPVLTLGGVLLPSLVGGAFLVEKVFAWPGMGLLTVDAVLGRDYHLVVGSVLVTSVGVVAGTFLADVALLWADPRVRRPT